MKDYHPYVFDIERRKFIGQFEAMYQAEQEHAFDSWQQEDQRDLTKRVALTVLAEYNFGLVLDVGCGKGSATHHLKKPNNRVMALDISETALRIARGRFPDIEFRSIDVTSSEFDLPTFTVEWTKGSSFDLVVCLELLSYVPCWQNPLKQFAQSSVYSLIGLFVPENPIGFVKSFDELEQSFSQHFSIIELIHLRTRKQMLIFGKSKQETR